MSRISTRNNSTSSKQKFSFEAKQSQSSLAKTLSRASLTSSNVPSFSNSISNITLNFMKDSNFPKLFNNSPMLFSFNGQPQSSKNSTSRSNSTASLALSMGTRTPSLSNLNSPSSQFTKDYFKKNNVFGKKASQLQIDASKKSPAKKLKLRNSQKKQKKQLSNDQSNSDHLSLYDSVPKTENIKVFIRIKPPQNQNLLQKTSQIMRVDSNHLEIDGKIVNYDHVFAVQSKQEDIFQKVAQPVVDGVFSGYNGTVFAYGQTGSGKTHTIFGGQSKQSQGLIPRAIYYIFQKTQKGTKVSMSLLEIYKQQLIDLFSDSKQNLKIKEAASGVAVEGLSKISIEQPQSTLEMIRNSLKNRRVASTKLNQKSSRSHTILTVYIESMQYEAKLCLIDLAGSQKVNKAGVVGENFEQMKKINYSLSCLGNVINALVTRKKSDHIPFRDSKLTRLLKDSLSGKFRTSIIVNCSSDLQTLDETISSLKFADRAKKVKITITKGSNKGKQNVEYLQKVIQQLTTDLQSTKRQLTRYKQICIPRAQEPVQKVQRKSESPEITTRTTIPSERVHIDVKMKKYGKQNKPINVILYSNKQKNQKQFHIDDLSSLNVSKSTSSIFGEINSPSVSSLTYRPDENIDDLSFQFSNLHRDEAFIQKYS